MNTPEKDRECLRRFEELKRYPRLFDWVDRWAKEKPTAKAIIEYNTGEEVTWKDFAVKTKAFAAKLLAMGIGKGDIVATSLPLLKEHIYLMYACYRIGAIVAPLDLRLKAPEVDYCFSKMRPRIYFSLGKTDVADFRPILSEMIRKHGVRNRGSCAHFVQFQKEADLVVDGAMGIGAFALDIKRVYLASLLTGAVRRAQRRVGARDPILIIFTTGSTGYPKPALLCSENILVQNIGLAVGFEFEPTEVMLVNLPPSHVGCVTEQLATTIYGGGTSVILHIFKPDQSLDAVQKYKVTVIGQIPALFAMEWRLPNYKEYDLSSLKFALYGGQAVTRQFLEQLSAMAPRFGTGLGLTETGGFCTYSPLDGTVDDILSSVGFDMPLYPISIREPMQPDGTAGKEKAKGEVGEITFKGPQTFLGYLNDEENTRKTISSDGYVYTGDVGCYDEKGLHFAGRSKFVIKPKGYQVFPAEIEDFVVQSLGGKAANAAAVGQPHDVFTEAIVLFVEKRPGVSLSVEEVMKACEGMAAYKRPSHVVILEPGQLPLNRVAKTDYMALKEAAQRAVEALRAQGGWDRS